MKATKAGMASSPTSQKLPSERTFGFMFTIILAGVGIYGFLKGWNSEIASAFIGACLILGIISVLIPKILIPFNIAWFHLGQLLGKIISPIVLGIIFFGLLTPIGLVCRMAGRDELKIKRKPVSSFWVERNPPGPAQDSFKNQF